MPDTITGGAYLVNEKWVDAEGKPLTKAQSSEAQRLHDERAAANLASEQERVERAVRNDPMAQVLATALNRPAAAPHPVAASADDEAPHQRGRRAAPKEETDTQADK